EVGRVRTAVAARGGSRQEPTQNVARLTWVHHFAKVPGSRSRSFTMNPIKMQAYLETPFEGPAGHPADEPFPVAEVDIRITVGGFTPPYVSSTAFGEYAIFQTQHPFRHIAQLCATPGSDRVQLCLEHTEVNGATYVVVD